MAQRRTSRLTLEPAICFFADCWGFKHQVVKDPHATVEALTLIHAALQSCTKDHTLHRFTTMVFSDSIFIGIPLERGPAAWTDNKARLGHLLGAVEHLTCKCFDMGLPMRGSFGFGGMAYQPQLIVGPAMIEAYNTAELIVPPLPILTRASLQRAVDDRLLAPETLGLTVGSKEATRRFVEVPTRDGGVVLGEVELHNDRSVDTAVTCFERLKRENDSAARPDGRAAAVCRSTLKLLDTWKKEKR